MRSPRVRAVSSDHRLALAAGWECAATPAGAIADPAALDGVGGWTAAAVPGTAAGALRAAGAWSWETPRAFDGEDWWWRTAFDSAGGAHVLGFDGLATLADVWLDGLHVLASASMFAAHELAVTLAPGAHALVIRCRALAPELAQKRPRPRWKVPMLEQQQLRWIRTTLLGRTPGWSPPCPAVGPWRGVWLERRAGVRVGDVRLRATIDGQGDTGIVEVDAELGATAGGALIVSSAGGGDLVTAPLVRDPDSRWRARAVIPRVARWWPHTHGEPVQYAVRLEVSSGGGKETPTVVDLGATGFRTLAIDRGPDGTGFAVRVNGVRVFCRGACWTPLDVVTLAASPAATRAAVAQARAAGMNMLRLSGTMTYADDALLDALDAAGILVWQDLMFANMDYPDDAAFAAAAAAEVDHELARLQARPSLAIVCGNSEGAQQAAMWGAARDRWAPPLFEAALAEVARARVPDAAYVPSSATGGAFPHAANAGPSSYYGVGAYLRPLEDARRAEVRFASECLAFANVPYASGLHDPGARVHAPGWKTRAPRDLGAGWDFDDVRDHYVRLQHGVDPAALRYADHERYLALGRATTGEVMARTIGEWRRARSTCAGALVWFLRDLWPGAGWGVVDARGAVKPCWHALRRAQQPTALAISDEGVNGLAIHAIHDGAAPLAAQLEVVLYRGGQAEVGRGARAIVVPAHGALELAAAALFDGFLDLGWAYRFGPPVAHVVRATLVAEDGARLAECFHLPAGAPAREADVGLTARASQRPDGAWALRIATRRFAHAVTIDAPGFAADDDFFDLAPGDEREVVLHPGRGGAALRGSVGAVNAEAAARIET